ncbi:MAG: prepilin-type N-terminal cleavage/methylation domain-containing protein [Nitriliruptorales bacterium]|nr:prepilin-type N-terminal cleavage/methylation domain-containing protein [Nitriliruptorales bacterium]
MPTPGHSTGEEGFSVVELLVAISLFAVVSAAVASGLIGGFRSSALVTQRTTAMSELQVTVERVAREIRAAAPVQLATAGGNRSLHVRRFRPGSCARVTYRVEGSELAQYTQPLSPAPSPPGTVFNEFACTSPAVTDPPPAGALRQVLVRDLAPGTAFVYRRAVGTPLCPDLQAAGCVMDFSATDASRPQEADIRTVELTVRRNVPRSGAVQVQTRILLRNQKVNP